MRVVLSQFDSPEKNEAVVGKPDKSIVGKAKKIFEEGERTGTGFPRLGRP
jgi:hypothetical protein